MSTTSSPVRSGLNLSLVAGTLSSPPELRTLPSGATVASLQLSVRPAEGPVDTVPVTWADPPPAALAWASGQELVVVGRVRRRFFRSGGVTASRTEVVAESVLAASRRQTVTKALRQAIDQVEAAIAG